MRIPLQLILLGLGVAATALIVQGAKRVMSGKHKRSPQQQGDSPAAKEARLVEEADLASTVCDSEPTDKEIAAAEAARARLDGETIAASTSQGKLPDGPEPTVVDIEYVASSQLLPLEPNSVDEQLQAGVQQLTSKDWTEAIKGLNVVRQAAMHHKRTLEPLVGKIVPLVLQSVKSLRSSLCKTAVMCVADLFAIFGDAMVPHMDTGSLTRPANSLLLQLLLKASSNDKRFVIEEVQLSLTTMARSVDPAASLDRLLPYAAHKNPRVRAQVATVLAAAAQQMAPEDLAQYGRDQLLKVGGDLVTDNTPDARTAARDLLAMLRKSHEVVVPSSSSTSDGGKEDSPEKENSPATVQEPNSANCKVGGALAVRQVGKDASTCRECSSGGESWESYCRSTLAPAAAAAVLKVVNK